MKYPWLLADHHHHPFFFVHDISMYDLHRTCYALLLIDDFPVFELQSNENYRIPISYRAYFDC
jgi:hypothetical protein